MLKIWNDAVNPTIARALERNSCDLPRDEMGPHINAREQIRELLEADRDFWSVTHLIIFCYNNTILPYIILLGYIILYGIFAVFRPVRACLVMVAVQGRGFQHQGVVGSWR